MNDIEIILKSEVPESKNISQELLHEFIESVLRRMGIDNWCMSLVLSDNNEIQDYNRRWRNLDMPTDVLTFAQCDGEQIPSPIDEQVEKGDIIVSLEQVLQQADMLKRPLREELGRVIIHGILHLNGMDHPGDDYDGEMLSLQEQLVIETRLSLK